jgi:hypothetical protein
MRRSSVGRSMPVTGEIRPGKSMIILLFCDGFMVHTSFTLIRMKSKAFHLHATALQKVMSMPNHVAGAEML